MKGSRNVSRIAFVAAAVAATCATAAHANTVDDLLARNAAQQAHIRADLAASKMDPLRAAQVQQKAADVYREQAQTLADTSADPEQLRQAQRDLAGAILWAEKHPARNHGDAMDRTHLQVAAARNAEQQRLIAREFTSGRLSADQAAALERAQADIASAESTTVADGHESMEEARAIQGSQDVQDYSIKQDPNVDERMADLSPAS